MTVLIVDDNQMLADNLCEILTNEGYACATASDGDWAIAHLQRERFEDQPRAASDAGVTEILDKPFDSHQLVRSVHRWLRSRVDDRPRHSPDWHAHARVRPAIIPSLCELRS